MFLINSTIQQQHPIQRQRRRRWQLLFNTGCRCMQQHKQKWKKNNQLNCNSFDSNNNSSIQRIERRLLISIFTTMYITINLLQIIQSIQIPIVQGTTGRTTRTSLTRYTYPIQKQQKQHHYGWIQTRSLSSEYNGNNDRIPIVVLRRKSPLAFVASSSSSLARVQVPVFREIVTTASVSTTTTSLLLSTTTRGTVRQSVTSFVCQKQQHSHQQPQHLFFRSTKATSYKTSTSRLFSSSISTEKEERNMLQLGRSNNKNYKYSIQSINECIGSGSYGTVHSVTVKIIDSENNNQKDEKDTSTIVQLIGKRHWNQTELYQININDKYQKQLTEKILNEKYQRCQYYWTIEKNCYETLFTTSTSSNTDTDSSSVTASDVIIQNHIPNYIGTDSTKTWMLWEPIITNNNVQSSYDILVETTSTTSEPIPLPPISSLAYYLEQDHIYKNIPTSSNNDSQQQQQQHVHDLQITSKALFPNKLIDNDTSTSTSSTIIIPLYSIIETVITQLLQIVSTIHTIPYQIVHRDIKPSNILINNTTGQLMLIDFGSASILSSSSPTTIFNLWSTITTTNKNNNNDNIVAVSPIYAAPEIFINNRNDIQSIFKFDVYSIGLLIIQLLFQYTDDRLISSFKQQLLECNHNIDLWLQQQLQSSKVRPIHIIDAIYVLQYYPGLWTLLQHMLYPSPTYDSNNNQNHRVSSIDAYNRWMTILQQKQQQQQGSIEEINEQQQQEQLPTTMFDDGPYIQEVFRFYGYRNSRGKDNANANDTDININDNIDDDDYDECPLPMDDLILMPSSDSTISKSNPTSSIRPLHYVVTFSRSKPLGLILSEATGNDDEIITFMNDNDSSDQQNQNQNQQHKLDLWNNATMDALPGQVFIQDIVPNGQADSIGIFHIGDRFHGVGDLSFNKEGFERAIELIQDQPRDSKFITLHFDRKPLSSSSSVSNPILSSSWSTTSSTTDSLPIEIIDQGAWVSKGKRSAQEDAFIVQAIQVDDDTGTSDNSNSYLLVGVFDGHLGSAASLFVQNELPQSFRNELLTMTEKTRTSSNIDKQIVIEDVVRNSWEKICISYRDECERIVNDDGSTSCAAEYDPVNGILMASTGSKDAIAGTTAVLFVIDKVQRTITTMNCGDSRGLLLDSSDGTKIFQTIDHTPQYDFNRFVTGLNSGYDYCIPKCNKRTNTWRVEVGDYDYAVARSLEGNFATSKGIVSTPDITTIPLPIQFDNNNNSNSNSKRSYVLVLATDGFWEVIDSEEATNIIVQLTSTTSKYKQQRQQQRMSASDIAKYLCTLAIQKGSSDNVSVIIVFIQ